MHSGPKAILYQSNLFRTSELVWIKVAPLAPWRALVRWSLMVAGLAFYFFVAWAKGSYWNLEGLLGLLAWHVSYYICPEVRLASSGDMQETYESRGGSGSANTFRQWISALSEGENECKLRSSYYQYWFNLDRIAWAGPCWLLNWYPLILIPVFLGYRWLITLELPFHHQILDEIHFLTFETSTDFISFLCWLIAFFGLAGWATSLSTGVKICASGGLQDQIAMSAADRDEFLNCLAGNRKGLSSVPQLRPESSSEQVIAPQPVAATLAQTSESVAVASDSAPQKLET